MKHILYILFIAISMASCGGAGKYTIDGELEDVPQNSEFKVLQFSNGKMESASVIVTDGKFHYEGSADEITPVLIYGGNNRLLLTVYAKNGDNIKFKGTFDTSGSIEISGSDVNEDLQKFVQENQTILYNNAESNYHNIETLLGEYISKHKKSAVSTILLMNYYPKPDNYKAMDSLLAMLNPEAKPMSLTWQYEIMKAKLIELSKDSVMSSIRLLDQCDSMKLLIPSKSRVSIVYFWDNSNNVYKRLAPIFSQLSSSYSKKELQIVGVSLDIDSNRWRSSIKADSVTYRQMWAPGTFANSHIMALGIPSLPYIIVTDSLGRVRCRTVKPQDVAPAVRKVYTPKK